MIIPTHLEVLKSYQKEHPEETFRVVSTHRGYHVFLTSHAVEHRSQEALDLMRTLQSDHPYILSCYHRGFSVRLNRKDEHETPYCEVMIVGTSPENSRLVSLYQMHLQLYMQCPQCEHHLCMKHSAIQFLLEAFRFKINNVSLFNAKLSLMRRDARASHPSHRKKNSFRLGKFNINRS